MNKDEFLEELEKKLSILNEKERQDIIHRRAQRVYAG